MKLVTWNVNSLRVRLEHVLEWMSANQPHIVGLQETKLADAEFPVEAVEQAGYKAVYAGERTYNGVAILSRKPPSDVCRDIPGLGDRQKRIIAATYGGIRVINVYVPNGQQVGSDKYDFKLQWLQRLADYVAHALKQYPSLALIGDFNIAPEDRDVHDPALWRDSVLFSEQERRGFRALLEIGLTDVFRKFEQPPNSFSWWDYRAGAFRRDLGLRIDHILCSRVLEAKAVSSMIDKTPRGWPRPSDHVPVIAQFGRV
jgi:exodeoxyribonuclease III